MSLHRFALTVLSCSALALATVACSSSPTSEPVVMPDKAPWGAGAMATAANPHAVDAAVAMLSAGGHAVDAAIAAHAVLGLVEPQSSGLGGGAFMMVYQRDEDSLVFHDGREISASGATPDMFMQNGEVMGFLEAWQSGLAIGVPGVVALYEDTHRQYGRLPWATLLQPAIDLANEGFEVSPRMAGFLPRIAELGLLDENPGSADYFYPGGKPLEAGQLLKNAEYADTLTQISEQGRGAFYSGDIAAAIVQQAIAQPNPGTLSLDDMAAYETRDRDVLCRPFRDLRVCAPSAPSSATAQIMMLAYYDQFTRPGMSRDDKLVAFVDAQRLAYADRDHYYGDPDFTEVPEQLLLDPAYLRQRGTQRFAPDEMPVHGTPGVASDRFALLRGRDTTGEVPGTSHLSIVDAQGNAVSMTATVEAPFGSGRWAAGFLLNNEMTDFAREYNADEPAQVNAVGPRKRPRSSMSPIMVFDENNRLLMVTGSPGGNSIPAYVFKSLVGVLDWGMTPQQAADFPNVIARGERVKVEVGADGGQAIAELLKARGYNVEERKGENSGLNIILVEGGQMTGASDSRREGKVGTVAPAGARALP